MSVQKVEPSDAGGEAYDALVENAGDPQLAETMAPFKEQLIAAIVDLDQVPDGALFDAAMHSDGSGDKLLRRLWRDLYPDEPVPRGGNVFEGQYWRDDPEELCP
ncbi:hypothetical protein [Actinopolymorpha pittospori]|uniref:Uncharacterized protein n=1 Tax=Actinopolymorpha pittospori TaxID=648752 RepID=A0A927MNN1_9ACTN|nr:hypothetical protein [Actinopolymorpha pittospori]MBE1603566.1 hypothetical protein [Actinopolymorpha pittospori]